MTNKESLIRIGIKLEYATLGWNAISCIPLIVFSRQQNSLSLFGFGIDSLIEILASVMVIWQLKTIRHKRYESLAVKMIGFSFVLLSAYLVCQAVINMKHSELTQPTVFTIIWLTITAIVMFSLATAKAHVGKVLQNAVLLIESKVTIIDGLLAVSVLIGLICVKYFNWIWMDLVSSLIICVYGLKEAYHAFKHK